ncbi:Leucine Rich Repeat [Seminavis robusta]|uniref:Leucine Rich Repeat n=1 Tax=Seminavis robusta TaxID=568900 RepID=A0A9N8EMS1_9STRA|nr:Leucine Rich Repeat [Seminavis robusta]|eukprot:Sro1246_g255760.1 Leucine Rich Repeat (710) ;mRNA; f:784-3239
MSAQDAKNNELPVSSGDTRGHPDSSPHMTPEEKAHAEAILRLTAVAADDTTRTGNISEYRDIAQLERAADDNNLDGRRPAVQETEEEQTAAENTGYRSALATRFENNQRRGQLSFFPDSGSGPKPTEPQTILLPAASSILPVTYSLDHPVDGSNPLDLPLSLDLPVPGELPGAYRSGPGESSQRTLALDYNLLSAAAVSSSATVPLPTIPHPAAPISTGTSAGNSRPDALLLAVASQVEELQHAEEMDASNASHLQQIEVSRKRFKTCLLLLVIAAIAIIMILVAVLLPGNTTDGSATPTSHPSQAPTSAPSMSLEGRIEALLEEDTLLALEDPASPQSKAFEWLLDDSDKLWSYSDDRIKQKFALAALYYATNGEFWAENSNWLNHSVHECEWFNSPEFARKTRTNVIYPGYLSEFFPPTEPPPTTCSPDEMLYRNLWLNLNNLVGSLPEELYMLTSLKTLSLGPNQLHGSLSSHIGKLTQLEGLAIFDQPPEGNIPSEIGFLTELRDDARTYSIRGRPLFELLLTENDLTGTIPTELGNIESLEWLVLSRNRIDGTIPSELAMFPTNLVVSVGENDLVGTIPRVIPTELGQLTTANFLAFENNQLSGQIPSEFGYLRGLGRLTLANNSLSGTIPEELSSLQQTLHTITFNGNPKLSGTIPEEVCNMNGTGVRSSWDLLKPVQGLFFDCGGLLCGCGCSCGMGNESKV